MHKITMGLIVLAAFALTSVPAMAKEHGNNGGGSTFSIFGNDHRDHASEQGKHHREQAREEGEDHRDKMERKDGEDRGEMKGETEHENRGGMSESDREGDD